MLTKNFQRLQTEVTSHVEADRIAQGCYSTCFIGCLAKGNDDPEFIQNEFGIPLMVSRIAENIFEALPETEAPKFFASLPSAVECDGKDLSLVGWKFLASELHSLPAVNPELELLQPKIQKTIDNVIEGIDLLANGKQWSEELAKAAARDAASALASAARESAYAAANAASAPRIAARSAALVARESAYAGNYASKDDIRFRQRDLLLTLIKEAPKQQEEPLMTKEINGYKIEPGAELKYADLSTEDLNHANLRGADLNEADLMGADLRYADLTGANLRLANLRYADLTGANLRGADLTGAALSCATFTNCKGIKSAKGISKKFLRFAHKVGYLIYEEDN